MTFLIFSQLNLNSQTKEETTEWLNQNLDYYDKYALFVPDMSQIIFNESFSTVIRNGFMLITYMDIQRKSGFSYFIVDLKFLKYIKVKNGEFVNYIFLGSRRKEFVGEELEFEGDYIFYTNDSKQAFNVFNGLERPSRNAFSVKIKSNNIKVYEEKLSDRIVKAFNHLVNLYGGKIVSKDLF